MNDLALAVAALSLIVTIGMHVFRGGQGVGELRRDIDRIDNELKRLRDWRHDVGDKPGFAAFEKLKEWDHRLQRCERALNGFLDKVGRQ